MRYLQGLGPGALNWRIHRVRPTREAVTVLDLGARLAPVGPLTATVRIESLANKGCQEVPG